MEIKFDEDEYPRLKEADKNQVVKIKGEGRISGEEEGFIVVEFSDLEVESGNAADKSEKNMSKREPSFEDTNIDEDEF